MAALFALHPLRVESVAWIAERKDVLCGFFWMLTLIAYVRYTERLGLGRYLLVALMFCLGLMAKPMARRASRRIPQNPQDSGPWGSSLPATAHDCPFVGGVGCRLVADISVLLLGFGKPSL